MAFNPALTARRARQLRKRTTDSEARLWTALRTRPGGLKWRRQHPLAPYIVDFFCAERRVAIEIDGDSHASDARQADDARRAEALRRAGVKVLSVPALAVGDRLDAVVGWVTAKALAEPTARTARASGAVDPPA